MYFVFEKPLWLQLLIFGTYIASIATSKEAIEFESRIFQNIYKMTYGDSIEDFRLYFLKDQLGPRCELKKNWRTYRAPIEVVF